ncbi:MAG: hypothetical protein GY875_08630 [Gammaproteobacteria bacterium]|nr:hypothetical protein [Gammaproteobacteria bacterium]
MKFTKPLLITKLKATAVHLGMSVAVFIYLAYQIYFNWYPEPYFSIDGGWQGIRLVGAVDLVLGPLITFLIFDLRKSRKEILFDLLVIVTIQIGALAYGVYATYSQKPIAIVVIDQFVISTTMEHYGESLSSASELAGFSDEKPPIVYSDFPLDREGIDVVQRIKLEDRVLEHAQVNLYRGRAELKKALQQRQMGYFDRLDSSQSRQVLEHWLGQNQKPIEAVLIVHFQGRYGNAWLVFDEEARYLGYFYSVDLADGNSQ